MQTIAPSDNAGAAAPSWSSRAAALSEATQALLAAAVLAADETTDRGGQQLAACAGRFDSTAAALQVDLLALAGRSESASQPRQRPLGTRRAALLREIAAWLDADARDERPAKRARIKGS